MDGGSAEGDGNFGDRLTAEARSIIADARRALADPQLSEAEAVHDVRKALKRWRALMRLLARPLGDPAEQMRVEARDLMRALTGARDAQSSLDALSDIEKGDLPFSETSVETIRKRMTDIRDKAEQATFSKAMRERLSRYLDFASLSLDRWPMHEIEFDIVADAITATYRRGRQLVPEDWRDPDPEHLHDLRRRVVEHRHQMEVMEQLWPRLGQVWAEEAQRLRNRLGACQDLAVLVNLCAPHQPLAHWRSRLAPLIEARRAAHLKSATRLASRIYAEKPKAFRNRIAALWAARETRKQQS